MTRTPIDQDTLLDAIETGLFLLPELPGRVDWLSVPGIRGRMTPSSDFFANTMGASTLNAEDADETIGEVCDLFVAQNKEFGWLVGPRSTPTDLAHRLNRAGLEKIVDMAGMVHTDLGTPIRTNPAVRVREAMNDDLDQASRLLAPALGVSPEGAQVVTEALLLNQSAIRTRVYLAFVQDTDEPVAYASTIYFPDQPIVVLFCAATLEPYRGKGIYTSLVARRLGDAYKDGARAAVIQAVRATSAPICQELGFVEFGSLEWYVWSPEDNTGGVNEPE